MNTSNYYKNINNEFDKKINKKIVYNNIIKSTQKSNSRISIFTKKSNTKNKKDKGKNTKPKETSVTNTKKPILSKKEIKKEKQEKTISLNTANERLKPKGNSLTNKKSNKQKSNEKDNKLRDSNNNNKVNKEDIKKLNQNTEQKNISITKRNKFKESIYDSPFINKNLEDDLVTSFERKPSDLKSPETISENSFLTDEEETNNNKNNNINNNKEKKENNTAEKEKEKETKDDMKEDDLIEHENEIIYVDKIKGSDNEKETKDEKKEIKKLTKNKNKNRNEVNIKVNVKTSIFNDIEKKSKNKGLLSKYLNQSKKKIQEKSNTSKEKYFNNSNNNININIKKHGLNNSKVIGAYIPVIQKSITVKKNQILSQINLINIETKYNRNTSKTNQIDYLEPVQELKKNLSNHSLKFCSDKKLSSNKDIKNKNKNNGNNKANKKVSQIDDKYEDIIFHKKLKIDDENTKEYQKINMKDLSSSNNKNTNISSSLNYTYKEDDIRNKKIKKDIIFNRNDNNESKKDINNTSVNNNIKLIKENKNKNKNDEKNKSMKNKNEYYLKKNTHLVNKSNNKLALSIDDSNAIINNNCKKLKTNMSGNNIIYAPKKAGMARVRSHEKTAGNIYSNMSYDPNRARRINQRNYKNNQDINYINNLYSRKRSDVDLYHFFEKNNSFCGDIDNYGQILLNNENALNTLRLNAFNNMPRYSPFNYGNFNGNRIVVNNNSLNYYNKTAEKSGGNNSLFMLNRLTSGERVNYNNYLNNQDFNRSMNMGMNINTDFNNYNMNNINNINMIDSKSFVNKINQCPNGYNLGIMSPFNNNINQTNLINLFNNNYLNFNTIQNKASSFIHNYNPNDLLYSFPNNNTNKNNSPSINIEDIIILQEKLKDIITALNKTKIMANECFEFWNFYYNCSIYCQLEKLFTNPIESNTVRICINYQLLSIMICYDYSFDSDVLEKSYSLLLNIVKLNHRNLLIICEHILSKISNESINNIWVKKLSNIINSYKQIENIRISNMSSVDLINLNTNIILQNIRVILKNYKTMRNECLSNYLNNICDQTYEQINIFFREYILRTNNLNGSILASVFLRNNTMFNTLPAPYVRTKNNKEYSLVLDLDETLVHFKEKMDGEGNGVLRIRPGINEFLDKVGKYYELIIFTTATQDYADLLIDAVEEDKIYFDHRLYREHAVIIDNDFVKDLTRIGRPLDKIIIVDNMPQNFKLQKENGIMIKAFWGEDCYDTALYELIPILVNIAKEGGDVRKGVEKYKDEILKKVSSSISKENI